MQEMSKLYCFLSRKTDYSDFYQTIDGIIYFYN